MFVNDSDFAQFSGMDINGKIIFADYLTSENEPITEQSSDM